MSPQPKHDPIPKQSIVEFLPEHPVIVEAGAHCGRDTVKMHELWPHGIIHAFEPVPHIFKKLKEHVINTKNIACHNIALSNTTGLATMYISDERCDTVSSLLQPHEFSIERPEITFRPIQVPTTTLDEWARRSKINHVDFLWLDMQGSELLMLKAAPKMLKTVRAIHTEVSFTYRYKNNPLYPEVRQWLEKKGFEVAAEHFHHTTWGDVLFVRS